MADKKSLFAGRTGERTAKRTDPRTKKADAPPPPPSPPPAGTSAERKRPVSYSRGGAARGVAVSAQRRETQIKEAEDYLKHANKCLQKTITRWNPNYFSAAPLFEKAGACYRAAGEDVKATAMYTQAGECQCHDTVSAHASAAKDFREAALITERQGRNEEAAALFLRCAEAWVNADEPGRAADYLGRSAKLAADIDEDEAAERYLYASTVVVPSGSDSTTNFIKVVGATEVMVQAINFLATTNRLEECMQVVERYCILLQAESIEHSLGRMYLTYCILALARGDYVKADAVFRDEHLQSTTYLHSEECRVEEELLTAFKDLRPDLLTQVQQDRTLRRLETAIVRLAKSLRVPGDDEEDAIPARETPSGTIGEAQTRVGALKEKYGAGTRTTPGTRPVPPSSSASPASSSLPPTTTTTASSSSSPSPPDRKPSAKTSPTKRQPPGAAAAAPLEGHDDLAKDSLFGGARKASPPLAPAAAVEKGKEAGAQAELSSAVAQKGYHEEPSEAEVDLGLGDLEATLEGGAEDDSDDLDAMIEAARREAEALGLGAGESGSDEESDEDDIDLT